MYTTSRKVKHINLEAPTITCEHGFFVYVIVVILHSNAVLVSMLLVPSALVALKPIELMTSEDYLGQNLLYVVKFFKRLLQNRFSCGTFRTYVQGVQHWKQFYAKHKDYTRVGKVLHPPIDPDSPVPEHCNPKQASPAGKGESTHKDQTDHREL